MDSTSIDESTGPIWTADPSAPLDEYSADAYCRNLAFEGLQFRIPTMIQMSTLFDYAGATPRPEGELPEAPPEDLFHFANTQGQYADTDLARIDVTGVSRRRGNVARVRCVALYPNAKPLGVHYDDLGAMFYDNQTHLYWTRETSVPAPGGTAYVGPGTGSFDLADAKNYCRAQATGGFHDWRVPTTLELLSLYWANSTSGPMIDPVTAPSEEEYFASYFASDPIAGFRSTESWTVSYLDSSEWPAGIGFGKRTRCVRGPEPK